MNPRKRESYLMIDHRASPGVKQEQYREAGFNMPAVPEGKMGEYKVLVCWHCNQHLIVNPLRQRERGFCRSCMEYICDVCVADAQRPDYAHKPLMAKVDETLERISRTEPNLELPPLLRGD